MRHLLRTCARYGRLDEAMRLLGQLQERGEESQQTFDVLVAACSKEGDIDDETLRLWEEGSAQQQQEEEQELQLQEEEAPWPQRRERGGGGGGARPRARAGGGGGRRRRAAW